MIFITIVNGASKPTHNWAASHCIMYQRPSQQSLPVDVNPGLKNSLFVNTKIQKINELQFQ